MHPDQQTLTLKQKIHEYGDVYSFLFTPEKPLQFTPGMYAHVRLPNGEEGHKTHEFSIASAPSEELVRFSMHTWEGSPYKKKIMELKEGDAVEIFKIKGDFVLPEDATAEAVLIAGGIGITPIRSMLIESHTRGREKMPILVHVASDQHLFKEELSKLPSEQKRITRSEIDDALGDLTEAHPNAEYYVSGPPAFVASTVHLLRNLGIYGEHIHTDEFEGYEEIEV